MKIISTSDWHLGNLFHGNDRLPEHRHFLNWLLDQITTRQPDALLVAGDIFDNGNPSAAAQHAYYEFLAEATRACQDMTVVITAGNHDSSNRLEAPRPLLERYKVEIRGNVRRTWVPSADEEGASGSWQTDYDDLIIPIQGRGGDSIVVLAVPYLRSDVVADESYSHGVNRFLRQLTDRARQLYPDKPTVMMAHLYAHGTDIADNDASEKIIIGGQEEVNIDKWEGHPDYMTCGHIHKRQRVWGTDWARYTGSALPMSFAEKDYRHGVDLLTIGQDRQPEVEFVEYRPQHPLRVLPEGDEALPPKKLQKLIVKQLADRQGDKPSEAFEYVELRVLLDKPAPEAIRELESLMATKDAVLCKTQKVIPKLDITTITDSRRIGSIDDILNRDPLDTLREAFAIRHGSKMSEEQEEMIKEVIIKTAHNRVMSSEETAWLKKSILRRPFVKYFDMQSITPNTAPLFCLLCYFVHVFPIRATNVFRVIPYAWQGAGGMVRGRSPQHIVMFCPL